MTALKKACRKIGVNRWPYRKRASLPGASTTGLADQAHGNMHTAVHTKSHASKAFELAHADKLRIQAPHLSQTGDMHNTASDKWSPHTFHMDTNPLLNTPTAFLQQNQTHSYARANPLSQNPLHTQANLLHSSAHALMHAPSGGLHQANTTAYAQAHFSPPLTQPSTPTTPLRTSLSNFWSMRENQGTNRVSVNSLLN